MIDFLDDGLGEGEVAQEQGVNESSQERFYRYIRVTMKEFRNESVV